MKSTLLLETLEQRLAELALQIAPFAEHATISPRFDRQLFRTRSTQMSPCLEEARENMQALRHAVKEQQLSQVAWLAEHLSAQIAALSREMSTWSLRAWDNATPGIGRWQRKRLEHQQFERRLLDMKQAREDRLTQVETLAEQQQLHKEITAFEERIRRCRHALDNIERVLARLTR